MRKICARFLLAVGVVVLSVVLYAQPAFADTFDQSYTTATVHEVVEKTQVRLPSGQDGYTEHLKVIEDGTGVTRDVLIGSDQLPVPTSQLYAIGQRVILSSQKNEDGSLSYFISDQYRIPSLIWLAVGFFALVVLVSRFKGVTSLLGMALSMGVLIFYMVPQIAHGANPVLTSIIGSGAISAIIIYFGHGFHYRSHVALFCMLTTLALVGLLSHVVVQWSSLSGTGDETANYLQFSGLKDINLQGLFLGGIILAALSVLDDSVISQVSVIYQLKEVKKDITVRELIGRGMEVGKDHISTLVNTLILAYAGASLPLFILFSVNNSVPVWVSLNDQFIAEEIVRTLTGSIGLVLSIPLTTIVASYVIAHVHKTKKRHPLV